MKIALINENSQAAKNGIIEAALKKVVEPMVDSLVAAKPWKQFQALNI